MTGAVPPVDGVAVAPGIQRFVADPGRDRSRLDRVIGLKRDDSDPWVAAYADHIRVALPLIALAVVLAGLVWPMFGGSTGIPLGRMPQVQDRQEYMRMTSPHFAGNDKGRKPYTVTADHAVQRTKQEKVFDLARPKADLLDGKNRWLAITADTGRYDEKLHLLDLAGEVTLFQDNGHTLVTERARVDLDGSAAYGDRPVTGHGPSGELAGEGFHASQRGERVVLTGKSRVVLEAKDDPPASTAPTAPPSGGG
ncbi:MAG: LPS export ABC transporter periplasmic protein LptC [Rhodospirillales bacterium]|nr:MAG: LPS export ABC transporter periplasmic protein LptC [Rhodospirillales bacterium]